MNILIKLTSIVALIIAPHISTNKHVEVKKVENKPVVEVVNNDLK